MQGHGILWYASLGLVIELRSITCSVCWGILHNTQMDSSYVVRKCPAAKKQMEKGSFTVQMDSRSGSRKFQVRLPTHTPHVSPWHVLLCGLYYGLLVVFLAGFPWAHLEGPCGEQEMFERETLGNSSLWFFLCHGTATCPSISSHLAGCSFHTAFCLWEIVSSPRIFWLKSCDTSHISPGPGYSTVPLLPSK